MGDNAEKLKVLAISHVQFLDTDSKIPGFDGSLSHFKQIDYKPLIGRLQPYLRAWVGCPEPFREQVTQNKENNEADDENRKEKKRSQIPAARDILPENAALNAGIGKLRDKYICPTGHFYVNPDDPDYFMLGNAHVESWVATILKGLEFAMIKKPPNNNLSDKINPRHLAAHTLLLQSPQININFPPDFANLLRPVLAALPPPPPAVLDRNTPPMLIPASLIPGADLSIDEFCTQYGLDDDICDRFKHHKLKGTKAFSYVILEDLKEMWFAAGEIAELKVVIAAWAQMLPV
ncbi:hypothetical protein DFH07DRAFT_764718 [Mycena maculata]|uniref:Uncharacterized protein n=1 Tax=Mycena maculata TaxID=230809 RepID=A0AAD7P0E3_9AGAR|nr:hypothetical protein DFH07DRAFT_764718 [Mycena maculata]